jgi:Protein of unknown function (DUF3237)
MDPEFLSTMDQPRFEFAMEVRLRFTRVQQITKLPTGGIRSAVYVDSGEFFGPKLKGKAVPNSGGDYSLFRPDDVAVFDARYMLQEDDGTLIMLYNKGFLWGRKPDTMDRAGRPCRMPSTTCARAPRSKPRWASTTGLRSMCSSASASASPMATWCATTR